MRAFRPIGAALTAYRLAFGNQSSAQPVNTLYSHKPRRAEPAHSRTTTRTSEPETPDHAPFDICRKRVASRLDHAVRRRSRTRP